MDKEKEIEEMKKVILKGFEKANCSNGYTKLPYPYFDSQITAIAECLQDSDYRKADEVRKETAKEILDLLIRYDDGDSNSEAIKLIIDHYGLQEYIEVDE